MKKKLVLKYIYFFRRYRKKKFQINHNWLIFWLVILLKEIKTKKIKIKNKQRVNVKQIW
jgi:hypothetical protein